MREFENWGVLSLIFFASYCVTYSSALLGSPATPRGSESRLRLSADHQQRRLPVVKDEGNHDVALKINNLNDTHQQLIVHWVGEGSPIIICLARDAIDVSRRTRVPSAVYYSYDYGETFENKTHLFKMPNETIVQLDKFYIQATHPSSTIFTDSTNKFIFVTEDHGKSFQSHPLSFVPNDVLLLPSAPPFHRVFLVYDKTSPNKRLFITEDSGSTWTLLQEYVRSYEWFSVEGSDFKDLIVQREERNATTIIRLKLRPLTFLLARPELLLPSVIDLTVKGDYIFATKNSTDNNSTTSSNVDLFIKYKSGPFIKAKFATVLARKNFLIADVTENRVMVAVEHSETLANLYVSGFITENTTEINFSLSMERIFCQFSNSTSRTSPNSVAAADAPFVDLHKVEGLRGIYIASFILPAQNNMSTLVVEDLASRITFNWGVTWRALNVTHKLGSDNESSCLPVEECSLHVSQKFALLYPSARSTSILSSKSAPGIIMTTGVYGKHMKGTPSVFMSRDGGVTFKQVLRENAYFNMGDHGGILVAIKFNQKQKENVSFIMYSTDMGESWQHSKLDDTPLRVYSLMTEPGENTTVFSLFGSPPGNEHHWIIIKADFQKVFHSNCTEEDFKVWSPYNPDEPKINCVLGRKETFKRRRPNSKCYTGSYNYQPIKTDLCPCDKADYMCDEGFFWDIATEHCIRNKTLPDVHYAVPKNCPSSTYFRRTKGYKRIPGDMCEGGIQAYEYDMIPCPLKEQRDFLLLAQKDRIIRIQLENQKVEVLPLQSLQNVIAIEYDMRTRCVFYADIVTDVISKWCMDSASLPKTVVDNHLNSVEGMAFDWVSRHLYFVDGVRSRIEVVRVDVENSNRYRRTIINGTIARKPRGIAVHPIAGYMFWTDWVNEAPSIYRAYLDGSNPTVLFTAPTVTWPNGITVDFIAERIYWVDAKEDYIASSDFFGKGFHKVIEQDARRVSHPFSVAVFKDNMYWDDWRANSIFVADKDHGLGTEVVANGLPGLMDLKIFAHSIQEGVNGCLNNTCSHMCFGLPNNKTTCACPDEMTLVDGRKCVCPGGREPMNGICPLVQNTCAADYFTCSNGECVPIKEKCDGYADCVDKSDELNCENSTTTCGMSAFRCRNGKCIPASFTCDHDFDCPDQSDEEGCKYPSCKSDQFACDNGRCISAKWRCDSEDDCHDASDERNCSVAVTTCTLPDEYKCPGDNPTCIPKSWLCDDEPDCPDGSDEKECASKTCDEDRFQCESKKCIFIGYRCDREDDCGDNSDELNCTYPTYIPKSSVIPYIPPSFPCNSSMTFQCDSKRMCVPLAWKCDWVPDCDDASDEIGCGIDVLSEAKVKLPNKTVDDFCGLHDFPCASGHCVPQSYLCDRVEDCPDGDDEKFCNGLVGCRTDGSQFRCRKTGACIDAHMVCDGAKDCADGSDEGVCKWSNTTTPESCPPGFFRCDEFRCEPLYKKCDGVLTDCVDGTDEKLCIISRDRTFQATDLIVEQTTDDSVTVSWHVKPPKPTSISLEYLPSISSAPGNVWTNKTWTSWPYFRFQDLRTFFTYNVTVYVRDATTKKTYPSAYYLEFRSGYGVPSPPRDVKAAVTRFIKSGYAEIEVTWLPPKLPGGIIQTYTVIVEPATLSIASKDVSGNVTKTSLNWFVLSDAEVEYKIKVIAKNEVFTSAESRPAIITLGNRGLQKVTDLRADSPTDYSITLKWKPEKPNLNYTIEVAVDSLEMDSYPSYASRSTNETQYTVTGLSPGVRYNFWVYATQGNQSSEKAHVEGSTIGVELPKVTNISVGRDGKNEIVVLKWNPVNDVKGRPKYAYGVYYGWRKTQLYGNAKNITNSTSIDLYDLIACTYYLFDVGVILLSPSLPPTPGPLSGNPTRILTGIDVLASPTHVRILSIPGDEPNFKVVWSASCAVVNRPIAYQIRVYEVNSREATLFTVNASTNVTQNFRIPAHFGRVYNISVSTGLPKSNARWIQHETPVISSPRDVFVSFVTPSHAAVYWTTHTGSRVQPNAKHSYEVLVCQGDRMDVDKAKIYHADSEPMKITDFNFEENESYAFAVRTVTLDGQKSELSPVTVKSGYGSRRNPSDSPSASKEEEGTSISFMWLFIIFVVLVSSAAGFLYWKRKRSHINSFKNLANSHYNTRSGSTTFSGVNGLDLDDTPDIREHFSDDEPLVIT